MPERRHTDVAGRAHDAIGQERRTGERVRPAARPAGDTKAIEAELVGERAHVGGLVGHTTAAMPIDLP